MKIATLISSIFSSLILYVSTLVLQRNVDLVTIVPFLCESVLIVISFYLSIFPIYFTTVWMKSLTMFLGASILLHHYKSDFAHLLAFKNLVIEFLNAKR